MIYLPFIFGVLKKFRSFVEITKLKKQRNDRLKDILHNLLAYYQTWLNLENFYTSFVIYSKSALYKIHIAFKEQIRNKTVFFYNSVFFSFHLISFFALGNI